MIASKKYVDETLRNHNLVANKALGQNFLVEDSIASTIIDNASINSDSVVIEIGPGLGALTELIVKKANKVIAYEIDKNMVSILNETFKDQTNLEINHINFLDVDIESVVNDLNKQGYNDIIIVSNLPYYITTKILNKVIINNLKINKIVTMMQKEVAKKIISPDSKEYNTLNAFLDLNFNVSILTHVSKNFYLPRPEIDSIVLKFERVNKRENISDSTLYNVCQNLYSSRRKTLNNNLKELITDFNDFESKTKIMPSVHVEQLSINDIILICKYLEKTI